MGEAGAGRLLRLCELGALRPWLAASKLLALHTATVGSLYASTSTTTTIATNTNT